MHNWTTFHVWGVSTKSVLLHRWHATLNWSNFLNKWKLQKSFLALRKERLSLCQDTRSQLSWGLQSSNGPLVALTTVCVCVGAHLPDNGRPAASPWRTSVWLSCDGQPGNFAPGLVFSHKTHTHNCVWGTRLTTNTHVHNPDWQITLSYKLSLTLTKVVLSLSTYLSLSHTHIHTSLLYVAVICKKTSNLGLGWKQDLNLLYSLLNNVTC